MKCKLEKLGHQLRLFGKCWSKIEIPEVDSELSTVFKKKNICTFEQLVKMQRIYLLEPLNGFFKH